jgi:hypothetical protein
MIPVYGFLEGDTLGLLILADEEETVTSLSDKLVKSAAVRVRVGRTRFVFRGRAVDPGVTVKGAGLVPLARFDVRLAGAE